LKFIQIVGLKPGLKPMARLAHFIFSPQIIKPQDDFRILKRSRYSLLLGTGLSHRVPPMFSASIGN